MTSDRTHPGRDARADDASASDMFANDRVAQIARAAHDASLDRLSPRVQAQLAQRRRAALAQDNRPAPVRVWPMLALGSAAALTLAVGLFVLHVGNETGTSQTPDTIVAAPPAAGPAPQVATSTTPDTTTALPATNDELPDELLAAEFDGTDEALGFSAQDESPDFYLWLGSQDAQADVTESL